MSKRRRSDIVRVRVRKAITYVEYAAMITEHGWLPDMTTRKEHVIPAGQIMDMLVSEANTRIRSGEVELI